MKIYFLYKKNIKILSFKMNIFSLIIINLLFLISNKVSDMKTSSNKEKKIRLLEDTSKKNSIIISIKSNSGKVAYLNSVFFEQYNGRPKELYLNNKTINFTSSEIILDPGNYTLEIVYDDKILTTCNSMFKECSNLQYIDLSNFDTSKVTDMQYMFESSSVTS